MNTRKLGLGLGAFFAGAVLWTGGIALLGARRAAATRDPDAAPDGTVPWSVRNDSVTAPVSPRPATMAAAPVGMAEQDHSPDPARINPAAEHVPTDLLGETRPSASDRAPDAFRPDPTAIPTAEEREALRPATGPAPSLVGDRGSGFSQATGAA